MIRGSIIQQRKKFIPVLDHSIKKKTRNSRKSKSKSKRRISQTRTSSNISVRKSSKNINIKKKSTKKIIDKNKINDHDYNSTTEKPKNTLKLPIRKNKNKLKSRRSINKFCLNNKNSKLVKFEFSKKKVYKFFSKFLNQYLNNFFLKKKIIGFSVLKQFYVNETFLEKHFERRKNMRLVKKSFLVFKDVKKYIRKASYQKYTFLRKKELEENKKRKKKINQKKKLKLDFQEKNTKKEEDFGLRMASPLLLPKPVQQEFSALTSRSLKKEKNNRYKENNNKYEKSERFETNNKYDTNEKNRSYAPNEINNKSNKKDKYKKNIKYNKYDKNSKNSQYDRNSKNGKISKNNKYSKNNIENKEEKIWDKIINNYIKKKAKTKIFTKLLEIYITANMIDSDKIEQIEKKEKKNIF